MGFSISWLAVQGKGRKAVLEELGLSATGQREEFPESPVTVAELPSGWLLVFANDFDADLVSDETLEALSAGCVVVACRVEEHVMVSYAQCYTSQVSTWRVLHDAERGVDHLDTKGDLPAEFSSIRDSLLAQQQAAEGVDYVFDVPIALAQRLTSFRHDEGIPGAPEDLFEVVVPLPASAPAPAPSAMPAARVKAHAEAAPATKPWWKFW